MDALQFVYFVDFGKGFLRNPAVGEEKDKDFVSAGLGLRFEFNERIRGRIDIGFPAGNEEPSDGSSSRVHVGVQWDLW